MDLDGLGIKFQALFLVYQEFLHILALISLELNHLAHLGVVDDGAIAGYISLAFSLLIAGESRRYAKMTKAYQIFS